MSAPERCPSIYAHKYQCWLLRGHYYPENTCHFPYNLPQSTLDRVLARWDGQLASVEYHNPEDAR